MRLMVHTALLVAIGSTVATAAPEDAASGWVPRLVVRAVSARPEGGANVLLDEQRLVRGEPASVTVWGRSLCGLSIGKGDQAQASFEPSATWRMTSEYLGEQNGRHQVRVTSGFTRLGGSESTATNTQTLSLGDGDNVVLDALSDKPDSNCPVHVVTFEARLVMRATDPALPQTRYTADLWLVHTDPGGEERREHLVMNIDGLTAMPFMFNRLAFPLPEVDPRQGNAEAVIQLTGALRARPRADGLVDLDVETNRMLFALENPAAPLRSSPTMVRKTLTVKPDETTAIDFPPPGSGFSMIALERDGKTVRLVARPTERKPRSAVPGSVEVKEDRLILYTDKFFSGHKTQLLITLKPLR